MQEEPELDRWRQRLQNVVRAQPVDPWLRVKVSRSLRETKPSRRITLSRAALCMVSASAIVAAAVVLWPYSNSAMEELELEAERAPVVMRIGIGDHVECALGRGTPREPADPERAGASLDPEMRSIPAAVAGCAPFGFRLVSAHHCRFSGHRLTHLVFRRQEDLLSLVIAARPAEDGITDATRQEFHGSHLEASAAVAGEYLLLVVSGLRETENRAAASALIKPVAALLDRRPFARKTAPKQFAFTKIVASNAALLH